jgi:hypothetical protein
MIRLVRVLEPSVARAAADRIRPLGRAADPIWGKDKLRRMTALPDDEPVREPLMQTLHAHGLLEGRISRDIVVLHSYVGCAQQGFHTDYPVRAVARAPKKPLGVLLALESQTRLVVEEGEISVPPGWACIFDGDLVHAGAAYDTENTRVHVYLDAPSVDRPSNMVWPVRGVA